MSGKRHFDERHFDEREVAELRTSTSRRLVGGLAVVALSLGAVAGCGSDDGSSSATSEASESAMATGEIVSAPELEEGWDGILKDVKIEECQLESGDVTAKGTVVNSAKDQRDLVLLISWNAPDSTKPILQLPVTEKDVPAGKELKWEVSGELPADAGECGVLARSGNLEE